MLPSSSPWRTQWMAYECLHHPCPAAGCCRVSGAVIHVSAQTCPPMKFVTAVVCLPWLDCTDFAAMVVGEERVRSSDLFSDTGYPRVTICSFNAKKLCDRLFSPAPNYTVTLLATVRVVRSRCIEAIARYPGDKSEVEPRRNTCSREDSG